MTTINRIDMDVFKVIVRSIAGCVNLEYLCDQVPQIIASGMELKGVSIFALNPETKELELLGSSGLSPEFINKGPVLAPKSIGWEADREPMVVSDVSQSDRLQYPDNAKQEGIAAIVSVPIIFHDKIIGALRLYHDQVWQVSQEDLDALTIVASFIGMVMMYGRITNALNAIRFTINEIHPVWLESCC